MIAGQILLAQFALNKISAFAQEVEVTPKKKTVKKLKAKKVRRVKKIVKAAAPAPAAPAIAPP